LFNSIHGELKKAKQKASNLQRMSRLKKSVREVVEREQSQDNGNRKQKQKTFSIAADAGNERQNRTKN
jgi:hypothetical protein